MQGLRARGPAVDRAGARLGGHHHLRRSLHPRVSPPRLGVHRHQHGGRVRINVVFVLNHIQELAVYI